MQYLWLSILVLLFTSCEKSEIEYQKKSNVYKNAAVVSAHPIASLVGKNTMQNGGNAFDAAVSVQMALAVVYPIAGNIGGGGFAVFIDSNGISGCLDYREKAPISAYKEMYLDSAGQVIKGLSTLGAMAVGVPGTVQGMWDLHQRYGQLPWAEVINPSIQIAKQGWALTKKEADLLNLYGAKIDSINEGKTAYTIKNKWLAGDSIKNLELAETLTQISVLGPDAFYKGIIAEELIQTMHKKGGILTSDDLKNYNTVWREVHEDFYKGYKIISMPPPSSGGMALTSMLSMMEIYKSSDFERWDTKLIHLMTEIEKRVYADRSEYLGDPDFVRIPKEQLLSKAYLEKRSNQISLDSATPSSIIRPGLGVMEGEETTHFSIVDQYGNVISITTTLNDAYGSKLIVEGAGFFLNNQMDDFSTKPGHPNLYGLIGGSANAVEGGKRMLSSMTPSIVCKDSKPILVIGTPGGSTIITSVFQNIINVIDYGIDIQTSVELPRFHHQWSPDLLYYEESFGNFTDTMALKKLGQNLKKRPAIGKVDAIFIRTNGDLECGADPRGDDWAEGF